MEPKSASRVLAQSFSQKLLEGSMANKAIWVGGVAIVVVAAAAFVYEDFDNLVPVAALGVNYFRFMDAPKGTLTIETAPDVGQGQSPARVQASAKNQAPAETRAAAEPAAKDWPSYNRTLASDRFAPETEISKDNAKDLQVLCTYDTGQYTGFNSGLLEVEGALLFTTEYDTFSIDPNTCKQNWRVHEDYTPATPQGVSRGPAYLDGRLYRGTQDGRVIAYDFKTGKLLWQTSIADPKKGESAPAAPIAWNGLVFIGNAGGDIKGVKGRMYALDAATGKIVWEFYLVPKSPGDPERGPEAPSTLNASSWQTDGQPISGGATWTSYTIDAASGLLYVPGGNPSPDFAIAERGGENLYAGSIVVLDAKTGAYKNHIEIEPKDWHDYDVSAAPVLAQSAAGKKLILEAPKDGRLYSFDLESHDRYFRVPVTKVENDEAPFEDGKPVRFCPGSTGGAEWNGPAYDPQNNLVMVGEIQWCTTVRVEAKAAIAKVALGKPWGGEASLNPYDVWGHSDPVFDWAGWVYAVDADSGKWRWRAKSNYPVQSGVTPTAGGVVFFGDMGGNLYALDATTGVRLFGQKIGGAVGGGVITYDAGQGQRVAAATGLTEVLWPSEITTAKVSVLGLKSKG
jgi:alcohol dehydrogenase (cytochrome c)